MNRSLTKSPVALAQKTLQGGKASREPYFNQYSRSPL